MRNNLGGSSGRTKNSVRRTIAIIRPGVLLAVALCALPDTLGSRATPAGPGGLQTPVLTATQTQQSGSAAASTQEPAVNPTNFEYDVASFKLDKDQAGGSHWSSTNDALSAKNVTLQNLVLNAYGIRSFQLSGNPGWLDSERYDIEAKADSETAEALQKLAGKDRAAARSAMLQKLLTDRLKLVVHRETKELPVYFLVVAKSGLKMKETAPDAPGGTSRSGGNGVLQTMEGQGIPVSSIAVMASGTVGRIIIDKTGLTGRYDFKISWSRNDSAAQPAASPAADAAAVPVAADPTGPSIFTALQEQLGLKLESGKGPVEIIVIEHVERPSGN